MSEWHITWGGVSQFKIRSFTYMHIGVAATKAAKAKVLLESLPANPAHGGAKLRTNAWYAQIETE